ncbi:Protein GLUTAMINE DUMPER 1 [Hibiscus syriacus]|uniref:Protein GLUTAMINE DUMPER 1 n=1 Tax=Hibiscus syriacus TaxID=106335 RepID=A0A6A3B5Z3_HIBSY|nr:protein GLUTAMINE DUMPER 2-like [Hibiscus syriacus]KAE8711278.1 Protein GLUTAMINE DUMPER 1 [Hibiscus syriacus]
MAARETYNATARTHSEVDNLHPSPWQSPVPYLFGGLAAMLGLIAFALLILACSYWKLSGYLEDDGSSEQAEGDLEAREGKGGDDGARLRPVMEPKVLVIMAGQVKPTFLATPIGSSTRSFSFGDNGERRCCCSDDKGMNRSVTPVAAVIVVRVRRRNDRRQGRTFDDD